MDLPVRFAGSQEREHPSSILLRGKGGGQEHGQGGNPPVFSSRQKWSYAAIANFCIGVMPPSAMFGRSWL